MRDQEVLRRETQAEQLMGLRQQASDQKLQAAQQKLQRDEEKRQEQLALSVARLAEGAGDLDTAEKVLRSVPSLGEDFAFDREAIALKEAQEQEEFLLRAQITALIREGVGVPGRMSEEETARRREAANIMLENLRHKHDLERDELRDRRKKEKEKDDDLLNTMTKEEMFASLSRR